MSVCLSNQVLSTRPVSSSASQLNSNSSNPLCQRILLLHPYRRPVGSSNCYYNIAIKAVAGDGRDSLDHLQRATKLPPRQQSKKKSYQYAPIGFRDRFPTARTVQQMMETMERLVDDPLAFAGGSGGLSSALSPESGGYSRGRTPWEIKEGEGEFKMRFDMPGMTKEDVKVWVEEKMLVVKAEKMPRKKKNENGREEEEEEEEGEWAAKSYGRYSCRIALPENIQFDKIKAEVKDGVLYITTPKATSPANILDINVE